MGPWKERIHGMLASRSLLSWLGSPCRLPEEKEPRICMSASALRPPLETLSLCAASRCNCRSESDPCGPPMLPWDMNPRKLPLSHSSAFSGIERIGAGPPPWLLEPDEGGWVLSGGSPPRASSKSSRARPLTSPPKLALRAPESGKPLMLRFIETPPIPSHEASDDPSGRELDRIIGSPVCNFEITEAGLLLGALLLLRAWAWPWPWALLTATGGG
mmetsp:Transcript_17852/g.39947  ORF Transcript_17852/g.39947 Transcript_17852/m.39947 type:complete len:216 (-) Transcript_17852:162-809(-)